MKKRSRRRPARPRYRDNRGDPELAGFDIDDRNAWERVIRGRGGIKGRGELEDVPGYLKGYRHGMGADELVQEIAEARGMRPKDVERAMAGAFHRRRERRGVAGGATPPPDVDISVEEWSQMSDRERKAVVDMFRMQAEEAPRRSRSSATGESRPRVRVGGDTFTLRPRSPFKGQVHHVNRRRRSSGASWWPLLAIGAGLLLLSPRPPAS